MTPSLRELLAPYVTAGLELPGQGFFRFHDAPPAVVRTALGQLRESYGSGRPNGQPPASWLVDVADELGGLVGGSAHPDALRVDAVCVPGPRAALLAQRVDEAFPEVILGDVALDLALAEAWSGWDAEEATWTGEGRALLSGRPEPVVGLWWD